MYCLLQIIIGWPFCFLTVLQRSDALHPTSPNTLQRWEQDSNFLLHKKDSHLFREAIKLLHQEKSLLSCFIFKLTIKNLILLTKIIVPSSKLSAFLKQFPPQPEAIWRRVFRQMEAKLVYQQWRRKQSKPIRNSSYTLHCVFWDKKYLCNQE